MKILILICCILAFVSLAFSFNNAICGLEHSKDGEDGVACRAYLPSWSYKADSNECIPFVYGGCGGNANRFNFREECEKMCKN